MPAVKGKGCGGKRKRSGRPKGTPNKLTTEVRTAILAAFDRVGGVDYLEKVAREDSRAFCSLFGKLVPTQLNGTLDVTLTHEQTLDELITSAGRLLTSRVNGHA